MPWNVQSQAKNLKAAEAIFLAPSISHMSEILQERTLAQVGFLEKKKHAGLEPLQKVRIWNVRSGPVKTKKGREPTPPGRSCRTRTPVCRASRAELTGDFQSLNREISCT
jgi:hypothetical protein